MRCNIIIAGVGGQGTLLSSKILGEYALLSNLDCKLSEVHGMSQRGGSVITYVKMAEKVYSPILVSGEADVILSFEELEAARYLDCLKKDGIVIYNSQRIMPMPVVSGQADYPSDIAERIKTKTCNYISVDAYSIAKKLGNVKAVNTVMIGVLTSKLGFDKNLMIEAFKKAVPQKYLELNIAAFEEGYKA